MSSVVKSYHVFCDEHLLIAEAIASRSIVIFATFSVMRILALHAHRLFTAAQSQIYDQSFGMHMTGIFSACVFATYKALICLSAVHFLLSFVAMQTYREFFAHTSYNMIACTRCEISSCPCRMSSNKLVLYQSPAMDAWRGGAPIPEDEDEREKTLQTLDLHPEEDDPVLGSLCKLVCSLLKVPAAGVLASEAYSGVSRDMSHGPSPRRTKNGLWRPLTASSSGSWRT
jgi:hypothetical protein